MGVAVQAIAQLAITYVPAMNTVFETAPLDIGTWLRIFAVAALTSLAVALEKWVRAHGSRDAGTALTQRRLR